MYRKPIRPSAPTARTTALRSPRARPNPRARTPAVLVLAATVVAGLLLSPTAAGAATPQPPTASSDLPALDAALDDFVAAGVPGILVRVQDPHRAALSSAAGVGDLATGAALRPSAQFRIGSVTKTFVSTVVLQLVGEGRLTLDKPVARWLPGLLANGHQITVRQLLNHTSGLPNYSDDPELLAGIVQNRIWDPRELVGQAETHPQLFAPGSAYEYSNTNYIVAGLLIEAVTSHPLARELDRRIFSALDLDHTSFPATTARLTGYYAHGYLSPEAIPTADGPRLDVTSYNPSHAWAAGAIVSNAADLSTFYRALLGGRLLSPRLLREMKKTVAEDPTDPAETFSYGLGLERVNDACGANWGHTGGIYGYQSLAYWNERTGRTVVVASNMVPAPAAAEAPLASATALALCGNTRTSSWARSVN
jgi:D-alanyl-D-alanine carboxypeptidase